jgi:hypothetical protein
MFWYQIHNWLTERLSQEWLLTPMLVLRINDGGHDGSIMEPSCDPNFKSYVGIRGISTLSKSGTGKHWGTGDSHKKLHGEA